MYISTIGTVDLLKDQYQALIPEDEEKRIKQNSKNIFVPTFNDKKASVPVNNMSKKLNVLFMLCRKPYDA